MSLKSQMEDAINTGNKTLARGCFIDLLSERKESNYFKQSKQRAERAIPDLYELNQQELPSVDNIKSNPEIYENQLDKLMVNFSKERMELLASAMESTSTNNLFEDEDWTSAPDNWTSAPEVEVHPRQSTGKSIEEVGAWNMESVQNEKEIDRVGMGLALTGLAIAGAGLLFSSHALTIIGGIATAGGVMHTLSDEEWLNE